MEEKFVKFDIFIDNENNINISSDIDDEVDYLSIEEKMNLIGELVTMTCKHILIDNYSDEYNEVEEFDENDKTQEKVRSQMYDLSRDLVQLIVNLTDVAIRSKYNLPLEYLEYCMSIFKKIIDNGTLRNVAVDTIYSADINCIDPIQSFYDFGCDVVESLIDGGIPKKDVKEIIKTSLKYLNEDLIEYVDEYENK